MVKQDCKEKGSVYHVYHVPVLVNTIRPLELVDVFIQRTGFVFYRTLLFVCLFVCGHKNEQFERNRAVYELYLLRMSQKSKNISFYIPHERERTSGSQEKQTFQFFSLY